MDLRETAAKNPMAATWTKAAKVRRAFKSGKKRQKDLLLAPRKAVIQAYAILHELRSAMDQAGLAEGDAHAALVFLTEAPDYSVYIFPMPEPEYLPKLYGKARELEAQGNWLPLGLVLHQIDREVAMSDDPKRGAYLWVQQWLMDDRSARALLVARDLVARGGIDDGGAIHPLH